jgi:hypothetical protein
MLTLDNFWDIEIPTVNLVRICAESPPHERLNGMSEPEMESAAGGE